METPNIQELKSKYGLGKSWKGMSFPELIYEFNRLLTFVEYTQDTLNAIKENYGLHYNTEQENPQAKAMYDLIMESYNLFCQKNTDYGTGNISALGIKGVFVRMNDKMARLKRLVWDDNLPEVKSETIEDTLIDLANYALIACLIQRGEWH